MFGLLFLRANRSIITAPHTEQSEPSVRPVLVLVAAIAGSETGLCPMAAMVPLSVAPHFEHLRVFLP